MHKLWFSIFRFLSNLPLKIIIFCVWGQEFWYIISGLDIQLEQYKNDNPASKNQFKLAKYDKSCTGLWFFSTWTHGLVAKARSSEYGDMGPIPAGCSKPLQTLCHFALHWACQWTDTFYSFLNVASGNLAVTAFYFLIWASDFHCLGALEWFWFYS